MSSAPPLTPPHEAQPHSLPVSPELPLCLCECDQGEGLGPRVWMVSVSELLFDKLYFFLPSWAAACKRLIESTQSSSALHLPTSLVATTAALRISVACGQEADITAALKASSEGQAEGALGHCDLHPRDLSRCYRQAALMIPLSPSPLFEQW